MFVTRRATLQAEQFLTYIWFALKKRINKRGSARRVGRAGRLSRARVKVESDLAGERSDPAGRSLVRRRQEIM